MKIGAIGVRMLDSSMRFDNVTDAFILSIKVCTAPPLIGFI